MQKNLFFQAWLRPPAALICALSCTMLWMGCSDDSSGGTQGDAATKADAGVADASAVDASETTDGQAPSDAHHQDAETADAEVCVRDPGPADIQRAVVVSHPYDSNGNAADTYEALSMDTSGAFAFPGEGFTLSRSTMARVVFTPDGEVGLVAQEDGTLGVFTVGSDGSITVVHDSFNGSFYAADVVMDPSGQRAYILDSQWRENGGGIYSVHIGCDGTVTEEGLWAPAQLPYAMMFIPGTDQVVVAAEDILDSVADTNVHLLNWSATPTVVASADAFGDNESIIEGYAITHDGKYVLLGDNNAYSSEPNRVAVVHVGPGVLTPVQVLSPVEDPVEIVTSPYDNAALVVSGFGDAVFKLTYDPQNASTPFTLGAEVSGPALPGKAAVLTRGSLTGWVFIAENVGVRQLVFETDGTITDLGQVSPGSGLENVVGAVGVQP